MNTDWKTGRIGDFFRPTRKPRDVKYAAHERIPFVPMDAVPLGGNNRLSWIEKTPEELTSGTYFERGDFLVARITPSFENGKQAVADNLPAHFGLGSTELIPLQEIPGVSDRWFLFYFLLLGTVRGELAGKMEGSTGRQRLPDSVLLDCPMSLPPLPEQRRIAAVLGKVQRAVELEAAQERAARELKQAVMRQLFTRGLRGEPLRDTPLGQLPESWAIKKIGSFASVSSGGTPLRSVEEYWKGGTIPWVKTGEVDYGIITEAEEKITEAGMKNSAARLYPKGTLLLAMYGQGITRGKVAILGIEATTNQACAAIISKSDVSTEFLFCYLAFAYERIRELGHGANQKNLSGELIADIEVPVPSPVEQREIATILGAIDRKAAVHAARKKALGDLFRTTLHALMTARLRVPEDWNHFVDATRKMAPASSS